MQSTQVRGRNLRMRRYIYIVPNFDKLPFKNTNNMRVIIVKCFIVLSALQYDTEPHLFPQYPFPNELET